MTKNTATPNASAVLAKVKSQQAAAPVDTNAITEYVEIQEPQIQELKPVAEVMWQEYMSAAPAVRTITNKGTRIAFTDHKYYTDRKEVVRWLDNEIANRTLPGITKGKFLTSTERDPVARLKKQHIKEYLAEQAQVAADVAAGKFPDMGTTAGAKNLGAASTLNVPSEGNKQL